MISRPRVRKVGRNRRPQMDRSQRVVYTFKLIDGNISQIHSMAHNTADLRTRSSAGYQKICRVSYSSSSVHMFAKDRYK